MTDNDHQSEKNTHDDDGLKEPDPSVPDALRNWQVLPDTPASTHARRDDTTGVAARGIGNKPSDAVEIDGEASPTIIEHTPSRRSTPAAEESEECRPDTPCVPAEDSSESTASVDSVVVATVAPGPYVVNPGGRVDLSIHVLNNGESVALFHIDVEDKVRSGWVTIHPVRRRLAPGERAAMSVTIQPPRAPSALAGRCEIAIVVQSPDYPGRRTTLPVALEIAAYDDVLLSELQPARLHSSLTSRAASAQATLYNNGNRVARVRVSGLSPDIGCDFGFVYLTTPAESATASLLDIRELARELTLDIEPGQSIPVRVTVRPQRIPYFGLRDRGAPIRVIASVIGKSQVPRAASGQLLRQPVIGPLHAGIALLLLFLSFFLVVMLAAVGLGLTRMVAARQARPTAQPQIVVIVPVNEQVPVAPQVAPAAPVVAGTQGLTAPIQVATDGSAGRDLSVPLVGAGQVSSPGGFAAQMPVESLPASAPNPSVSAPVVTDRSNMTYAQMFQEVGLQYDLDRRVLAAQAYVESRFDTLALGNSGDLGLMQILPGTWKEWSPVVDVNDPFDAYSNVVVAAAYLDYLRSLFSEHGLPEAQWMLVAYNWGPDKLIGFVDAGYEWDELDAGLRQYAVDILSIADTIPLE